MPDSQHNNQNDYLIQNDFLIEKIKVKPVNKRKLVRRTLVTVSMAVIFGLVACFTFLVLEPVISRWLYTKEEPQTQLVVFPEDQNEMSPEDMLAENIPAESSSSAPEPGGEPEGEANPDGEAQAGDSGEEIVVLGEEQVQDILSQVTFDLDSYREMYGTLSAFAAEMGRYMVTVTAVTSNIDWFNDVQESRNQCSGIIIYENGLELLILTEYSSIMSAERMLLTFYDGSQVEAQLKKQDRATNLAVLSAPLENLPEKLKDEEGKFPIAAFGNSDTRNLVGIPVIAVGSPMGVGGSVGYGMITSPGTVLSMTDRNYKLIQTNISGSQNASGALFNLQGKLVGVIMANKSGSDMRNLLTAYGITELQKTVEKMSNGSAVAYMGIRGVDVPKEANQELGVPFGAYVEAIDMDSPAMRAGIQRGDVITGIDGRTVTTFNGYSNILMQLEPGQAVDVVVMRQAQDDYKEMSFNIELGEVE